MIRGKVEYLISLAYDRLGQIFTVSFIIAKILGVAMRSDMEHNEIVTEKYDFKLNRIDFEDSRWKRSTINCELRLKLTIII